MSIFDRRLLFVTGKGGVGRTTTAILLGLAAGRQGRRTLVLELFGNQAVASRMGLTGRSYQPRPIGPRVDTASLTPYECLDDFGRQKLKVGALVSVLFHNRVFETFVDAVPGLHDLFQLGKINALIYPPAGGEAYDLVVIDAPATGHGLTLLDAANSMGEMVGGGLVRDEALLIQDLIDDPRRTSLALVTLPDDLPVNESLELAGQLGNRRTQLSALLANQVRDLRPPTTPPWSEVRQHLLGRGASGLIKLGDGLDRATGRQRDALARLAEEAPRRLGRAVPLVHIPRVEPRELSVSDLPGLAERLRDDLVGVGA